MRNKKSLTLLAATVLLTAGLAAMASVVLWWPVAMAAEPGTASELPAGVLQWGFIAAALSTGISALAAGYAVATVGSASVGAMAERPELFGRVLVMIGLAEGIAIYGLIVSILILNRLG